MIEPVVQLTIKDVKWEWVLVADTRNRWRCARTESHWEYVPELDADSFAEIADRMEVLVNEHGRR